MYCSYIVCLYTNVVVTEKIKLCFGEIIDGLRLLEYLILDRDILVSVTEDGNLFHTCENNLDDFLFIKYL